LRTWDAKDRDYFCESRKKRFGMKLEDISADRGARVAGFRESLKPIRILPPAQPFFAEMCQTMPFYCLWPLSVGTFYQRFSAARARRHHPAIGAVGLALADEVIE
jgi:hypothetical protein